MPSFARKIFLLLGILVLTKSACAQVNYNKLPKEEQRIVKCFYRYLEYEFSDTLKAKMYADSAIIYARKLGNPKYLGLAFQHRGWYSERQSNFKQARNYYYKSLSYMKKADWKQGIADAYGNLGNAYYFMNDLTKCLEMQLLSLEYNEHTLADESASKEERELALEGQSVALHNTGDLYMEIGLFPQAIDYLYESLKYDLEYGTRVDLAISYETIGSLYKQWNKIDSAELYFTKALEIEALKNQRDEYARTLIGYATLEGGRLSQDQRSKMANEALTVFREIGNTNEEAEALIHVSNYFFDQLSTDSLSKMLRTSYAMIRKGNLDELTPDYFKLYSRYNSRLGDFEQAYFALDNYLELKMVADEQRHTQDVIAGGIRYKMQAKFEQDSLVQQNKFATERTQYLEDISEIQNIVYLSVIGFILLIASLVYYVTSNRRKNRMNAALVEKNQLVQEQKSLVEERNKSISDSINYAQHLQTALLPTRDQINQFLPNSFLFFQPKDVVSGDFYWFENREEWCFLAVADCTGHGVPGALVSVVCSNALNRSVKEFALRRPKDILDKTRELVLDAFAKSAEEVSDGMDISLIAIHKENRKILFAGAHNGLWIVREKTKYTQQDEDVRVNEGENHVLLEWKGDKQPIGRFREMKPFQEVKIQLEENDKIYLMSDGFADQFGGPRGKKFKYITLKNTLLDLAEKPMDEQFEALSTVYFSWKGSSDQIDDVCLLGCMI